MTSRALTDAVTAAITAGTVRPVIFVEGAFYDSGSPSESFLRLWSGLGEVTWDGKVWTGAGKLLRVSPLEEGSDIKAVGFNVELSGLPQSILATSLANVRQGKPGRVWLGMMGREGYISLPGSSGNYAYTLDSAATSITSDIDIRAKIAADDWTPAGNMAVVDKRTVSNISYVLRIVATTGRLSFAWSVDGVTENNTSSTASPSVGDGEALWVRVTADFNTGGSPSVYEIKFWTSADGVTWTQLGSTVSGEGHGAIFDGAARLSVGAGFAGTSALFAGKIYYAEVREGIDGTTVAVFDPTTDANLGDTSFTSSATGEVWTINQSGSTPARLIVDSNVILEDPYLVRAGRMDYVGIAVDAEATLITAQYEDRLVDLERSRERRYTDEDQQYEYSGDGGFRFVAALQDKQLIWGGPGAAASPIASPSYSSNAGVGTVGRNGRVVATVDESGGMFDDDGNRVRFDSDD